MTKNKIILRLVAFLILVAIFGALIAMNKSTSADNHLEFKVPPKRVVYTPLEPMVTSSLSLKVEAPSFDGASYFTIYTLASLLLVSLFAVAYRWVLLFLLKQQMKTEHFWKEVTEVFNSENGTLK